MVFIILLAAAALTAYVASERGRDPFAWFVLALLLPLLALLAVIGLPAREKVREVSPSQALAYSIRSRQRFW